MSGMLVPSERERVHMFALRKPFGVVGLITPWNFPSAIPAWKLAPALICGNTVVLKPASAAPLSAWRIVEALPRSRHSEGRRQLCRRIGRRARAALVNAKPLKAVSFTGSCGDRPLAARRGLASAACGFSSRWAARIRPSCWPMPISTRPSRTWSTPRSSPPGRSAPPPAAPLSKTRFTTGFWRLWSSARGS